MGIKIRVDYPVDSNVDKVVVQSSSASTGGFANINGSPFEAKTGSIYIREFDDANGAFNTWYRLAYVDEGGTTGSFSEGFQPEGPPYCSARDVWRWLAQFTQVRDEVVGTSVTSNTRFSLSHSNVVEGTYELSYGSAATSATELVEVDDYYLDLDDADARLTSAGFAKVSGNNLYARYDYAPIVNSTVRSFIDASTDEVDRVTKRKWYKQRYTEYLDVEKEQNVFYLKNYPVISVSSLLVNANSVADSPSWQTRSAGFGSDYLMSDDDKKIGRFRFVDNKPTSGNQRIQVNYDAGYETVPSHIKRLAVLYTVKDMLLNPVIAGTMIQGQDTFNVVRASEGVDREIRQVVDSLKKIDYEMI